MKAESTCERCQFITRKELADLLEVTPARVSQMSLDGIFAPDSMGRFNRTETIHAAFRWFRSRMGEGKTALGELKTDARRMENEILGLTLAKARGEAIPKSEVDAEWENIVLLARQSFLGIANKLAPRMAFMKTEVECEQAIREAIEEALTILSRPIEYGDKPATEDA